RFADLRALHSFPTRRSSDLIHVAEGVDEAAEAELGRLEELGCLRRNTVLVHGVALSPRDCERVVASGASLVWCPASNAFLFRRRSEEHTSELQSPCNLVCRL